MFVAHVTLESALGLIGGTMGLLTGFSILSGVEIIYYVIQLFFSLRIGKIDLKIKNKYKNHLFWLLDVALLKYRWYSI